MLEIKSLINPRNPIIKSCQFQRVNLNNFGVQDTVHFKCSKPPKEWLIHIKD